MSDQTIDQFIKKALLDADLRAKFQADPHAALNDAGVRIPDGMTIKVAADSATTRWIHLPHFEEELSVDELDAVAGGFTNADFSNRPSANIRRRSIGGTGEIGGR